MTSFRHAALILTASLFLAFMIGCGGNTVTSTPPPPPPPPPPPATEPNNCKSVNVTSPVQPTPTSNFAGPAFSGLVMAGSVPVTGANVMIYAASNKGNGSAAIQLLTAALVTDQNGSFSVPASFTCPFSNTVLYAVASGGKASGGSANSGIQLVTILGTCGSLQSGANFVLNEATTVAAAYAMAQFFGTLSPDLGATSTNSDGIALAAATAANLADIHNGAVPGTLFPATGTAPIARMNSLADALNACVVSNGDESSACQQLYTAAYGSDGLPVGETAGETFGAVLALAKSPANGTSEIYTLSQGSSAYMPGLSAAPPDWTLAVNFTGGGMNGPSAVSIDSTGNLWVANYYSVASYFTNTGVPVFPEGITGDHLLNSFGGAVDVNDTFWVTNEESGDSFNNGLGSISVLNNTGALTGHYFDGGIDFPLAAAFDTSGVSWIVDYGDSSITLLDATGNPLSGTAGYSAANLVFPVAVATDAKCNAYVANQSSDTITRVLADGSEFTDYTVGQGPSGIAIDETGNIWSANYYGDSIGLVSATGSVLSGSGFAGGGIYHPQGIAIDGKATVWVANYRSPAITELAGAGTASPGKVLSPATGWAPDSGLVEAFGVAIDASGNLWTTSFGSNTLTEFVGLAAPVQTPLLGPVRVP